LLLYPFPTRRSSDLAYRFIGQRDKDQALHFLTELVRQEGNQYSYNNNWVIEEAGEVVATALVYDGSELHELRKPVAQYVQTQFQDRKSTRLNSSHVK